ncbi:MAG: GreA/GreB family elongation factor [Bacteriovoracaceae bacterium]|nr:GreA/GreB family elongation factor [Bacteriovoracaceae bacterium]
MEKNKITQALIDQLTSEVSKQKEIVDDSKALQTHQDLKSEGKYDTRAIEAGYLADAQRKRLEELELDLQMLQEIPNENTTSIQIGSLAELSHAGQTRWYFFSPNCGGTILSIDGITVLVISVFSPLGNEAVGLSVGDEFTIETPKEERVYNVVSVR